MQREKGTVLVIDDEAANLGVLFEQLKQAHFKVLIAEDGASALKRVERVRPDIILLDVRLPDIDGFELCRRLKSKESLAVVPVVFLSALVNTADKLTGLGLDAVDYITKPFEAAEVVARVEKHLTIHTLQKQLEVQNAQLEQEIAERKRAEESLRESEKKYKALFHNAQVALFRTRISDGKLDEINEQYAHMAGYSTIEDCMSEFNAADAWADPTARDELLRILREKGSVKDYETVVIQRDGAHKPIIFSATIFPEQGFLEGSIVDITERKRVEEALQESEERFRDLYENAPNAYFAIGVNGLIHRCNKRATDLLGYTAEDLVGQPVLELYADTPQGKERAAQILERFRAGEMIMDQELQMQKKDGSPVWISLTVNQIQDAGGRIVESRSIVIDITERKRAEEQIKAALEEKDVLLKEVYHRVKNNLNSLSYLVNMQTETIEHPETLQALGNLQGRVEAMSLVHKKLYQTKDLSEIDFGAYLEDLAYRLIHALKGKQHIDLHVNAENIFLDANVAIPCGMIVNELVTNAIKYAFPPPPSSPPPGGQEIRIEFGARDDEYVLVVADNGVGLPPDLDWRTADSLGLKLVNIWATYQLRGSINVDGKSGTVFTIEFPK